MNRRSHARWNGMRVSITAPTADHVFVAGDFNNWDPHATPMRRQRDGRWVAVLDLPPGPHEYKFIVDGRWCCGDGHDPAFDGRPGYVANSHGTMNIAINVPNSGEGGFEGMADC